jgi:glycosyltransferase involved in cell wall biosynthesis
MSSAVKAPKISVIIPCYNSGAYLDEAVDSVLAQTLQDLEIIIVDDGSKDPATRRLLADYRRPKTRVLRIRNQGPAVARNLGIAEARGKYILPLDADDRIRPTYLAKAARVLDAHPKVGIVYCRARFFGARSGEWRLPPYSLRTMLIDNVIFVTALFRKTSWQKVGGFNPNMVHGMEDYDFWVSLLEKERCEVRRLNEVLFDYRIQPGSRTEALGEKEDNEIDMFTRIFYNHPDFFLRENRMRVWVANRRLLLKELERTRAVLRDSPTLRMEAALYSSPSLRRLYLRLNQGLVDLLLFLKSLLRK